MLLLGAKGWRADVPNLLTNVFSMRDSTYFPSGDIPSLAVSYSPGPGAKEWIVEPLLVEWLKLRTQLVRCLAKKYLPWALRLQADSSRVLSRITCAWPRNFHFFLIFPDVLAAHGVTGLTQSVLMFVGVRGWISVLLDG